MSEEDKIILNGDVMQTFGRYKENVYFGSFDEKDITNIRYLARECGYVIEPDNETPCQVIKIMSADLSKWGWLRKTWHVDTENLQVYPDYVYGFWQRSKKKKRFTSKHSITPQLCNLKRMYDSVNSDKKISRSLRMRKILIPDLEKDTLKFKSLWKPSNKV